MCVFNIQRVFANYEINTKYIINTHFNKAIDIAVYFFFYFFLIFSIISNITIKSKCLLRRYFSRYFESLVVSSQSLWIYFIDVWNILDRLMNPYEPTKHDAVFIHSLFHYHLMRKSDYWNTAHFHYQQMPYRNFRQQKDF